MADTVHPKQVLRWLTASLFVCACGGTHTGDSDGGIDAAPGIVDAAAPGDSAVVDAGALDAAPPVLLCNDCHGDETGDAPPLDTEGNTATTARGVGAHRRHLRANTNWHRTIQCIDCHVVPDQVTDVGHNDTPLPAELTWSELATSDGATPAFVENTTTCSGVYCHGATLSGGTNTTPDWTSVGNGEATCGACHSLPPPAPHPAGSNCATCHPTMSGPFVFITPEHHIDGVVDVTPALGCTACHGSGTSPAPPQDTSGNVDTTAPGVGAHRSHLGPSAWHNELVCSDCHVVPGDIADPGHTDTALPAELTWGALALTDGASPAYDGAITTCSGVYCHGSTLIPGGTNTTPDWTIVGVPEQAQAACGTCHGLPPAAPHPAATDCASCHPTVDADLAFIDPARHIDGTVDVLALDCTSCHGDIATGDPAPPRDTSGNLATTETGVGAHQSHLEPSTWRAPIQCTECHIRPNDISDPGHVDSALPAELTFGQMATTDGASPGFDGFTCGDVYCHGATLIAGGTNTTPAWTNVGVGEAACGTCHGVPPADPHPQNTSCSSCHTTMAADNTTFLAPERHVDGIVDLIGLDCTSCHGDVANGNPAPPQDTQGNVATTTRGVGAHQSHLAPSTWRAPIDCTECHIRPPTVSAAGHTDTPLPAELTFGGRATADGATPSFDGASTTCSGVYCHGATLQPGGTNTTPNWTSVGTGEVSCGTCHSLPPGGTHTTLSACEDCHGAVVGPGPVIIAPALHVDGTIQVTPYHPLGWGAGLQHGATVNNEGFATCQSCHGANLDGGPAGVSCDSCHSGWKDDCTFCHGGTDNLTGAPPEGIDGETTRTLLAVGAHTEHVSTTAMHVAWTCDKCHVEPVSAMTAGHIDGDGRAEVVFGSLNPAATYTGTSGTCGSLYCHGNGSSTLGTMVWQSDPTLDCGSCHADFFSPTEGELKAMSGEHDKHVRDENLGCDDCHSANVDPFGVILQLDRHVDGIVDVGVPGYNPSACFGNGGCNPSCHDPECWN